MSDWTDIEEDMGGHNPETGMPYFIENELDMGDVKLHFTWTYEDYLAVTERENSDDTEERWVKVVALIDNKHYESVDDEIRDTIQFVDSRLKEDSNDDTN